MPGLAVTASLIVDSSKERFEDFRWGQGTKHGQETHNQVKKKSSLELKNPATVPGFLRPMASQRLAHRRSNLRGAHRGQQFDIADQQQGRTDSEQSGMTHQYAGRQQAKPQKNQSRCFHDELQMLSDPMIDGYRTRYLGIGANSDQRSCLPERLNFVGFA